jgi:hypothetical protein
VKFRRAARALIWPSLNRELTVKNPSRELTEMSAAVAGALRARDWS